MNYQEISSLSSEEQQERLVLELENLKKLYLAHAISPIENPMRIRQSRRLIAKLKTAQNASTTIK